MASFQTWHKRSAILLAFWTAVVLSLPAWWYLTSIQRLALPQERVQDWVQRGHCPIRIPLAIVVEVGVGGEAGQSASASASAHALRHELATLLHSTRTPTPNCEQVMQVQVVAEGEAQPAQAQISHQHGSAHLITLSLSASAPLSLANDLASSSSSSTASIADQAHAIHQAICKLLQLEAIPTSISAREIPYSRRVRTVWHLLNEDASVSRASNHTSYSGLRGWDAQALNHALIRHIGPIAHHLDAIHDIATESQVKWYAPLDFQPVEMHVPGESVPEVLATVAQAQRQQRDHQSADDDDQVTRDASTQDEASKARDSDESADAESLPSEEQQQLVTGIALPELPQPKKVHLITPDDLTVFVNSAAWGLSSPSPAGEYEFPSAPWTKRLEEAQEHAWGSEELEEERTLHFVLFVAAPHHRPLLIQTHNSTAASNSSGFLLPQWGGVFLHNIAEVQAASDVGDALAPALGSDDLDPAMRVFASQLRALLGLRIPISPRGSTQGQREARIAVARQALLRRRIAETAREAVRTLDGIIKLTHKIENLGIGPRVRDDVMSALDALDQLEMEFRLQDSSAGSTSERLSRALSHSRRAASHASRAFFNRDMLALLYFPAEHKYAVYTPLFGPVAVPLLVALARLAKERRKARSAEKEKEKESSKKER
ncbi:GPI transamidase complex, GPI17/PIG-S component, involved in glycosylphosphatidylinositol anchor biosynthesis [Ceraceosorus bombacis]|uniref:GPI transamidase complex, GPI17/PIG-S component, involved in glycosylphosphatidylinositol anchor biosynthesis n=1 Tax=Ceraceosorus bombacis TaxID=401625 RepID=A0A0N7LAM5_9BASI|nr:GPI transamidase complex, GPI17/PIG-S component, involved in glycosylphosphatidylinositol anchor biosynthesis [Ceraceosorus bombacis]